MKVIFKKVRWKNFLSTGNAWLEVELDKTSTTLMVGNNGSGKSILLDALCFGLFGKSFRKANKPTLVNSINNSDLLVEVEFVIGTRDYMIRRGIKPNIFEIFQDGIMINQSAGARDYQEYIESHVLKLNHNSFTQTDVLGLASYTPFMQLPAAAKREVIEDLLDIKVFSTMSNIVKEDAQEVKDQLKDVVNKLTLNKEKLVLKEAHLKVLLKDKNDSVKDITDEIKRFQDKRNNVVQEIIEYEEKCKKIKAKLVDDTKLRERSKKLAKIESSLETKKKSLLSHINLYQTKDVCPTCEQGIAPSLKKEKISKSKDELKGIDKNLKNAEDIIKQQDILFEKQAARVFEISKLEKEISNKKTEASVLEANIKTSTQKRDQIVQSNGGSIAFEKDAIRLLTEDYKELLQNKKELVNKRGLVKTANDLLKDSGIKTQIIKHYIPIINTFINKHLAAMDFFVQFGLDENFNEVIKSRYRDIFSYYNFSQGQKMRIDLALLLAWRAVAKLKNSINTNILILDEVFDASLDPDGCDSFLKLIYELASDDTNVFIISHRGDMLSDKFDRTLKFKINKNFTSMSEV